MRHFIGTGRHGSAGAVLTGLSWAVVVAVAGQALARLAGAALLGAVGGRWLFVISGLGAAATLALIFPLLSGALAPKRGAAVVAGRIGS
ncbi:hypothetical protein [Actinoplanes sp. NPDC026619]|uniref:hypothetical protein n=1 Tax=Actinoplanes sp. NPDC026619 TaxID=3155798 RepID=UPI0033E9696F